MSAKILVWDLENSPALGWFWGSTYQTNITKVHTSSRVMSFCAKWHGSKRVEYRSDYHGADGKFDPAGNHHDGMVGRIWELLDEADAVISYNGRKHDTPHINTEFLRAGAPLPSPYKEIDLYTATRGKLKFQQNRLDFVLQELEIGKKLEHEGFELWLKCMAGDPKAWARFRDYNIRDTVETEKYFDRILPYIPASMLPNQNLYTDDDVCPKCATAGSLTPRGFAYTASAKYPRFFCTSCGGWSQSKYAVQRVDVRAAA
jgi:hypothetical protein